MAKITLAQAAKMIQEYDSANFFTVTFVKRTTNELRVMNCWKGVKKHLKGGEAAYSFKEKNLVCVYDVKSEGYRTINLDSIKEIKMNGDTFTVQG